MKSKILIYILTIVFVVMFSGVNAQQEKYMEIRKTPSEITDWTNLEVFFKTKSIDSVQSKLDSLSQSYMSLGKWEIFLYLNNQVAQYLFRRGFYEEGREIAINAGHKVKYQMDTCNLEYIYGLQLMAESYYNSKLRKHEQALPYLLRAEKLLQSIDIPSMKACNDYYMGSSYIEIGDLEKG
ncbi:MAG: hypothetical protein JEZ03_13300, partial [Bacteroidales bacterium]|nr:hypothetical protein [Bacteroidales bacterium]